MFMNNIFYITDTCDLATLITSNTGLRTYLTGLYNQTKDYHKSPSDLGAKEYRSWLLSSELLI